MADSGTFYEVGSEEREYLRHKSAALSATIFSPVGEGPFPALVEVHGGAWVRGTRANGPVIKRELARRGVVVVAIDFRTDEEYPASLFDINHAVRFVKAHAAELRTSPGAVGIMGSSSGGHQAVLSAMRPDDPRYAGDETTASGAGAEVSCAVALWPVISPLGRYRYAKQMVAEGKHPELAETALPGHEQYWRTEEAMAEGDPVQILERGEPVRLPPVLCVQSPLDPHHPVEFLRRFAELYEKAGGEVELLLPGPEESEHPSVTLAEDPESPFSRRILDRVAEFARRAAR